MLPKTTNIFLIIFLSFIFSAVGIWVEMQRCFWANNGWCADINPLGAIFFGFLEGMALFLVLLAVLRLLRIQSFIKIATALTAIILIAQGGYFSFANHRHAAFLEAAKTGNKNNVEYWLRLGASSNATGAFKTDPVLYSAVESGSIETVEVLLKNKANPDGPGNCNIYHPLTKALVDKKPAIVNLLLSYGATYPCEKTKELLITKYDYKPSDFNR